MPRIMGFRHFATAAALCSFLLATSGFEIRSAPSRRHECPSPRRVDNYGGCLCFSRVREDSYYPELNLSGESACCSELEYPDKNEGNDDVCRSLCPPRMVAEADGDNVACVCALPLKLTDSDTCGVSTRTLLAHCCGHNVDRAGVRTRTDAQCSSTFGESI